MLWTPDGNRCREISAGFSIPLWVLSVLAFLAIVMLSPQSAVSDDSLSDIPDLERIEQAFQAVVERVAPSVVGIRAQRRYIVPIPGEEGRGASSSEQFVIVNGSGTVIQPGGLILTNEHVVQSADRIDVLLHDGRELRAEVVGSDARNDLCILRVSAPDLPPAIPCDWNRVARGQWTIAIGNPFGLGRDGKLSVSVGVISNLGRRLPGLGEVDDRLYHDMIQTTAAINPGNSGGPLFNVRGELLGIVTAMHTRAAADEGVGFAIPLTPSRMRLIGRLARGERIEHGYLGLTARAPDASERQVDGRRSGALVTNVEPDGPAARADLRRGDLIVRFDAGSVRDDVQLADRVDLAAVGETVAIELIRDGKRMTVHVTVEKRRVDRVGWMRGGAVIWRGMRLAELTPEVRSRMRVDSGPRGLVVIDVLQNSSAGRARIVIGDVVERIQGEPVSDIAAFRKIVRAEKGALPLLIRDRGEVIVQP